MAGLRKGKGSTGGLAILRPLPVAWPGCHQLLLYAHMGHLRQGGGPSERGQCVSQPGLRRLAPSDMVAVARGMKRWLRRPQPEEGAETRQCSELREPPRKAAAELARGVALPLPPPPPPPGPHATPPPNPTPPPWGLQERGGGQIERQHRGNTRGGVQMPPPPAPAPTKKGHATAAGKQPVSAGSPGTSTPANPSRAVGGQAAWGWLRLRGGGSQPLLVAYSHWASLERQRLQNRHMKGQGRASAHEGAGESVGAPKRV